MAGKSARECVLRVSELCQITDTPRDEFNNRRRKGLRLDGDQHEGQFRGSTADTLRVLAVRAMDDFGLAPARAIEIVNSLFDDFPNEFEQIPPRKGGPYILAGMSYRSGRTEVPVCEYILNQSREELDVLVDSHELGGTGSPLAGWFTIDLGALSLIVHRRLELLGKYRGGDRDG